MEKLISKALEAKIRKQRSQAINEVDKARCCANVIFAAIEDDQAALALALALNALRAIAGINWSTTTALQFMSGRQGQFAAEAAPDDEVPRLFLAHIIAKAASSEHGLGGVDAPTGADHEKLAVYVARLQQAIS